MTTFHQTPAPWKVWRLSPDSDPAERLIVVTADGETEVSGAIHNEADATLIAAAPDMLAALEAALIGLRMSSSHPLAQKARISKVQAAIAKANASIPLNRGISPIDAARAITPGWMQRIHDFDALEIHPCAIIGHDGNGEQIVEPCEPEDAHFWTVYGHYRTGGTDDFEDFATEAEARTFRDRVLSVYPHLAGKEG